MAIIHYQITYLLLLIFGIQMTWIGYRGLTEDALDLLPLPFGEDTRKRLHLILTGRAAKIAGLFAFALGPLLFVLGAIGLYTLNIHIRTISSYIILLMLAVFLLAYFINVRDQRVDFDEAKEDEIDDWYQ